MLRLTHGTEVMTTDQRKRKAPISAEYLQTAVFSDDLISNIKSIEIEENKEHILQSSELLNKIRDDIAKIIREKSEKEGITYNETKVLQNFPWISEQKMKKFIKELPTVSEDIKFNSFTKSDIYQNKNEVDSLIYISESIFGSWSDIFDEIISDDQAKESRITKANNRRKGIIKIINNQSLSKKNWSEYWDKMIDFIVDEKLKNSKNHLDHQIVGWEIQNRMTMNEIKEKPFEAIREMTSTRGRMLVLKKWEILIKHPHLKYQNILEDVVGFSVSKSSKYNGKYFSKYSY